MPPHQMTQTITNFQQKVREINIKRHLYQETIKENMCIQINTQFINLLVIKKNVNLYIGRKQSHVMMTE